MSAANDYPPKIAQANADAATWDPSWDTARGLPTYDRDGKLTFLGLHDKGDDGRGWQPVMGSTGFPCAWVRLGPQQVTGETSPGKPTWTLEGGLPFYIEDRLTLRVPFREKPGDNPPSPVLNANGYPVAWLVDKGRVDY